MATIIINHEGIKHKPKTIPKNKPELKPSPFTTGGGLGVPVMPETNSRIRIAFPTTPGVGGFGATNFKVSKEKPPIVLPKHTPYTQEEVGQLQHLSRIPMAMPKGDLRTKAIENTTYALNSNPAGFGFLENVSPLATKRQVENRLGQKIDTSQAEDTLAYKAGSIAGIMGQFAVPYVGASKAISTVPKVFKLGQKVGTGLNKVLPKVATETTKKIGQGVATSLATDLAVGVPLNVNLALNKEELRGKDALKNIAINTGIDLIAGGFLETIGGLILKSGKKVATKADFDKLSLSERKEALLMLPEPKPNLSESKLIGSNQIVAGGQVVSKKFIPTPKNELMQEIAQKIGESPKAKYAPGRYSKGIAEKLEHWDNQIQRLNNMPDAEYPAFAEKNGLGRYVADLNPKPKGPVEEPLIFKTQIAKALESEPKITSQSPTYATQTTPPKAPIPEQPTVAAKGGLSKIEKAYMETVDNQFALAKATKGIEATSDKNVKILGSNLRNAKGTAESAMADGLRDMGGKDLKTRGLHDILVRGKGQQEAFEDYLLHKHNVSRYRQGKPVFGQDILSGKQVTDKMSLEKVAEYEAKYPDFKALSGEVNDFNGKLIDNWLVESGLISEDLAGLLKTMYADYVPVFRSGSVPGKMFNRKGLAPEKIIKEAIGGNKPIIPLTKSIPATLTKTIRAARKNEVYVGLLEAIEKNPEKMSRWAKIVPESSEKTVKDALTMSSAKEALENNGIDGIENVVEKMLEIDAPNGKYYLTAMREGKPVRMEIHKDLFDGFEKMGKTISDGELDGMARAVKTYATNPFKALITGYNPIFGVKNMFRDIPTAYIQGTENNPLKFVRELGRSGKSMLKNDELYKEFKSMGGKKSSFYNTEKGLQVEQIPSKILRKGAQGIGAFNDFTETIGRYAEFRGTMNRELKKGASEYAAKQQGIYNSGEVTVNFARQGDKVKAIDTVVPYFNPAFQGIDKAIRNLRSPATFAKGMASITAPAASLYMLNQHVNKEAYDQLDNRTKDANFLIPLPGGEDKFIKIPKSREAGVVFGSLFERLFRLAQGQEDSFKGFGNAVATNFAPANPFDSNLFTPATMGLATNKDFANRTIVPGAMTSEGYGDSRSKYLQYDEKSSEIAKWIGKEARKIPGLEEGLSPKQIDYLIKSYTGIIGQILQPATTKEGNVADVIKRAFGADSLYNNEIQNTFYEAYDEAKRVKSDLNLTEDIPSDYVTPEEKRLSVYNKAAIEMTALRKEEKRIDSEPMLKSLKEKKLRTIRQEILDLAAKTPAEAEKVYEDYKKTYIPELSMLSENQIAAYKEAHKTYGVTTTEFKKGYDAQKDFPTDIGKAMVMDPKLYEAFEISPTNVNIANGLKANGLENAYNKTHPLLKGVVGSEEKKAVIDQFNQGMPYNQIIILYEAFDIARGTGHYSRQFKADARLPYAKDTGTNNSRTTIVWD